MFRKLFLIPLLAVICLPALAQEAWTEYYSNDQIKIESRSSECHYPEKGVHSEYILLKLTNKTSGEVKVSYDLDKWYNGTKATPDVKNYSITVPANSSIESTCSDLKDGLNAYIRILDLKPKSILSKFELNNLTINGIQIVK